MKTSLVKRLLEAAADGDQAAIRKAALQIAASESKAGHTAVASQLREIIDRIGAPQARHTVDIASPRGELAELLVGGFRTERLRDIVLSEEGERVVSRLLTENRQRGVLEAHGLRPSRHILFYGPPGCGKTLAAQVIAGELGVPLFTVRFDALFSRFLGETASHLKVIFESMPRRPGVYFFDEFDAVGKFRDDAQDVGEVRRVVTSFLQMMDADDSASVVIAATNHERLLDPALFRRFDTMLGFQLPGMEHVRALLMVRLRAYKPSKQFIEPLVELASGLSYADISRAVDGGLRTMVLDGRKRPRHEDLAAALDEAKSRGPVVRERLSMSTSCACGLTAMAHDMAHSP